MSNISTQATVNLTINGQQPIQVLQQLRQNALQLEGAIARAAAAGNRTDLRRLHRELSDTRRQIRDIESSTMQVVGTLSVALVDSSGGARQTIAKISIIFGVEDILGTKESILAVGSTVNVLSQKCTASNHILFFRQFC